MANDHPTAARKIFIIIPPHLHVCDRDYIIGTLKHGIEPIRQVGHLLPLISAQERRA
jgi:hypothetical protein